MDRAQHQLLREDLNRVRDEYLDERTLMVKAEHRAMQGFDKALLTLSATALGFSLTFTKFVSGAAQSDPRGVSFVLLSWLFFGLTVLATVCALYISHLAFRKETERLKLDYRANTKDCLANYGVENEISLPDDYLNGEWTNVWTTATKWLNRFSIAFFVAGLVFLVLYSISNFPV